MSFLNRTEDKDRKISSNSKDDSFGGEGSANHSKEILEFQNQYLAGKDYSVEPNSSSSRSVVLDNSAVKEIFSSKSTRNKRKSRIFNEISGKYSNSTSFASRKVSSNSNSKD